jgi:hypothetical protein
MIRFFLGLVAGVIAGALWPLAIPPKDELQRAFIDESAAAFCGEISNEDRFIGAAAFAARLSARVGLAPALAAKVVGCRVRK